ncbi:MAG TPA: hypothetical protein VHZ52_02620 [Acidobacteriaceae bacterium]|nr:hypothetical protein [Acidobacteriaceae bacterium]
MQVQCSPLGGTIIAITATITTPKTQPRFQRAPGGNRELRA